METSLTPTSAIQKVSRAPFVSKSIACVMIRHVPDVVRMHYSKMIQYGVAKRGFFFFQSNVSSLDFHFQFVFLSYIIKPEVTEIHPSRPRAHNLTSEVVSTRLEVPSYDRCFRAYLVRQYHQQQLRNRYAQFREAAHHFWVPPART